MTAPKKKISFATSIKQTVSECVNDMSLDRFEELLQGLADIEDDGYVHQVYSSVLSSVDNERMVRLLAESLHQRWMAADGFAPVAARLVSKLAELQTQDCDFQFGSMIYAMFMNDYRDREKLRAANPVILCNCTQFGFEFYNHFRHKGVFYESLINPLLDMVELLLDVDRGSTEHEIDCASHLLQIYGAHLQSRRHKRVLQLIVRIRRILITSEGLGAKIRYRLLEIIELSQNRWDADNLSQDVMLLYEDMRETYGDYYLSIVQAVTDNPVLPATLQSPAPQHRIPPPPLKHHLLKPSVLVVNGNKT